ncbi:MAG TPA: PrsW family intramembrane metalloprotease, partial [Clostridia bacterium]|nr:PrsW family intramembrane metalloprotease [Clostridia bacterium]
MTDIFRIIFSALSPVAALIILLLVVDRHDKEPAKLLIKQFIAGCLISIPAILIEGFLERFNIFPETLIGMAYTSFIVAGLTEESLKRASVYVVSYHKPAYNEKLDGIIYCAFASLGFAAVENIMYIINFEAENPSIALYRGIFSVPGHMLFAVTMGY